MSSIEVIGGFIVGEDTAIRYSISYIDRVVLIYSNKPYEYSILAGSAIL